MTKKFNTKYGIVEVKGCIDQNDDPALEIISKDFKPFTVASVLYPIDRLNSGVVETLIEINKEPIG